MTRVQLQPITAFLVLCLMWACSGASPMIPDDPLAERPLARDLEAALQTDALEYVWEVTPYPRGEQRFSLSIPFEFTNPLADTIFVVNCQQILIFRLELWEEGSWQPQANSGAYPLCGSPLIVIPPAASFQSTARLLGFYPGNDYGHPVRSERPEGIHRLNWGTWILLVLQRPRDGAPWPELVPAELLVSNRFLVRDPRE